MGSPIRVWWTVLWTFVVITVVWFVCQPLVQVLMDATEPFCTASEPAMVLGFSRFVWNWFPIIFLTGMTIWGIWASLTRPDIEYSEAHTAYG